MEETTQQRLITVSPDRVFRALLEPADLRQWFCDTADVEPRVGGRYAFGGPHAYGGPAIASGRIVVLTPDRALSFIWPLSGADTSVTYDLAEVRASPAS